MEGQNIYQFDVSLNVRGCGTVAVTNTVKTVLAKTEKEAREKLYKEIEVEIGSVHLKAEY